MIQTYNMRLSVMDHSKGTTNAMIQAAMKAEIMELRKALRAAEKTQEKALAAQHRAMQRQIKRFADERNAARERAAEWRSHATKYQKLAAKREH